MPHKDEHAAGWQGGGRAGLRVLQANRCHAAFAVVVIDGRDHGIPDDVDLLVLEQAFLQDLAGAQAVAAVDQRYFAGETGEEERFFDRAVAAANHHHLTAAEEKAVAGGAVAHAAAGQFLLAGHIQLARRRAGADDDRLGLVLHLVGRMHGIWKMLEVYLIHIVIFDPAAELFGLLLHLLHQLRPGQAFGKARVIFHFIGNRHLAADVIAGNQQGVQVGARRVQTGRQARWSTADDNDILDHLLNHWLGQAVTVAAVRSILTHDFCFPRLG